MNTEELDMIYGTTGIRRWIEERINEQANGGPFPEAQQWTTVEIEVRRNILWDLRSIAAGAGLSKAQAEEYLRALTVVANRLLTILP